MTYTVHVVRCYSIADVVMAECSAFEIERLEITFRMLGGKGSAAVAGSPSHGVGAEFAIEQPARILTLVVRSSKLGYQAVSKGIGCVFALEFFGLCRLSARGTNITYPSF